MNLRDEVRELVWEYLHTALMLYYANNFTPEGHAEFVKRAEKIGQIMLKLDMALQELESLRPGVVTYTENPQP